MMNGEGGKEQVEQKLSAYGKKENIAGQQQYYVAETLGRKLVGQKYSRQKDEKVED